MSLLNKAAIITTPTAHSNGKLHSIKGGAVADFDAVRGSVATRVASNGLIESVATNIPRIDYTTGEGVILTEPQSTNLIPYSEDFSNAYWAKSGASAVGGFDSPDGGANAFKLVEDTSTGKHLTATAANVSTLITTNYTESIFAKSGERTKIGLRNPLTNSWIVIDLSNGSILDSSGLVDSEVEILANGWYRISISFLTTSTSASFKMYILDDSYTSGSPESYSYTGDGTSGLYIWGAQVEALPYSTSYIPTSGAIATRLADSLSGAGGATTINGTEGVLYFEAAALSNDADLKLLEINNGGTTDRVFVYYRSETIRASVIVGGVTQCSFNVAENVTEFHKVAFKFAENDFALWIDGVEVATDTIGIVFSAGTLNNLQLSNSGNGIPFFAKTKAIAVFSEALTDEELTCLTTI